MKRVLLVLAVVYACFLFNSEHAQEIAEQVKVWFFEPQLEETKTVSSTSDSNYDAALQIVYEMIEGIESLLTPEQKIAIEKEVNELYKQNILQEYKSEIGPRYYE